MILSQDSKRPERIALFVALVVGAAARILGGLIGRGHGDVAVYFNHTVVFLRGDNVYSFFDPYPYPPGWLLIEVACRWMGDKVGLDFWHAIRVPIIAADIALPFACMAVAGAARARAATWAAVAYLISPIAVLISGNHGQFDSIPNLLMVLSAYCVLRDASTHPKFLPIAGGVLLAVAGWIKPHPVFLAALVVTAQSIPLSSRISYVIGGLGAAAVLLPLSFALGGPEMLGDVLGYSGVADQGLSGVCRSLWLMATGNIHLPGAFGPDLAAATKPLALLLVALTIVTTRHAELAERAALVYLVFLASYSNASSQYLVWPLPWLTAAAVTIPAVLYSVGAGLAAIGFYSVYWPAFLVGGANSVQPQMAVLYVVGELTGYIALLVVIGAMIRRVRPRVWTFIRGRRVAWASRALLFLVVFGFAYPVGVRLAWFTREYVRLFGR